MAVHIRVQHTLTALFFASMKLAVSIHSLLPTPWTVFMLQIYDICVIIQVKSAFLQLFPLFVSLINIKKLPHRNFPHIYRHIYHFFDRQSPDIP